MSEEKTRTQYFWTAEQLRAAGWRYICDHYHPYAPDYWQRNTGVDVDHALGGRSGAWLSEPPPPAPSPRLGLSDEEIDWRLDLVCRTLRSHVPGIAAWAEGSLKAAVEYERAHRERAVSKVSTGAIVRYLEELRRVVRGRGGQT